MTDRVMDVPESVAEDVRTADDVVRELSEGKPFFYRRSGGEWEQVVRLERYEGQARSPSLLVTPKREENDPDFQGYVVSLKSFLHQQAEATERNVAARLARRAERQEAESRIQADIANPTPEGIKRIFEVRYRKSLVDEAIRQFTNEGTYSEALSALMYDFQRWARGEDLDGAEKYFPGWRAEHFVEMLKLFDQRVDEVQAEVERKFMEQGVDVKATLELLRRAQEANRAMETAKMRLRNEAGIEPGLHDRWE